MPLPGQSTKQMRPISEGAPGYERVSAVRSESCPCPARQPDPATDRAGGGRWFAGRRPCRMRSPRILGGGGQRYFRACRRSGARWRRRTWRGSACGWALPRALRCRRRWRGLSPRGSAGRCTVSTARAKRAASPTTRRARRRATTAWDELCSKEVRGRRCAAGDRARQDRSAGVAGADFLLNAGRRPRRASPQFRRGARGGRSRPADRIRDRC